MTQISSTIELYDSDIIAIDKGPVAWMTRKQGTRQDLESFRRGVVEQFAEIGLEAFVKTYDTTEADTYAFDVEIRGRLENKPFDYDRMVHEVVNNLLDDPDQEKGFIKSPLGAEAAAAHHKHKH